MTADIKPDQKLEVVENASEVVSQIRDTIRADQAIMGRPQALELCGYLDQFDENTGSAELRIKTNLAFRKLQHSGVAPITYHKLVSLMNKLEGIYIR